MRLRRRVSHASDHVAADATLAEAQSSGSTLFI